MMKNVLSAAALVGAAALGYVTASHAEEPAPATHAGVPHGMGAYAIDVGGVPVGWVLSATGGAAALIDRPNDSPKKHVAGVKYEDITVQVGFAMGKPMADWIDAALKMAPKRKTGAVTAADAQGNAQQRIEFQNALISEIGFPALDVASKDAFRMTIKLAPELTRMNKASGKMTQPPPHNGRRRRPARRNSGSRSRGSTARG